jgi:hypothetical protein
MSDALTPSRHPFSSLLQALQNPANERSERESAVGGRSCGVHDTELQVKPKSKRTKNETAKKAPRKSIRPR